MKRRILVKLALLFSAAFLSAKAVNALVPATAPPIPGLPARPDDGATLPAALAALAAEDAAAQILATRDALAEDEADSSCTFVEDMVAVVPSSRRDRAFIMVRDPRTKETEVYSPRSGRNRLPGGAVLLDVYPTGATFRVGGAVLTCPLAR